MKTRLGIFTKQPIPGTVKTRLAARLGDSLAAALAEAFLCDIAARFRTTAEERYLCYSPATPQARTYFAPLGGTDYRLHPQQGETLGARLAEFFSGPNGAETAVGADLTTWAGVPRGHTAPSDAEERAARPAAIVVIGADSPTLPQAFVDMALAALEHRDCVIGPATDGGYYLIGLRRAPVGLFDTIPWGGPRVLIETLHRLAAHGMSLELLPPWYDVDTWDDLRMLHGHLEALAVVGQEPVAPATRRLLQSDQFTRILRTDEVNA
jgi:hypothetical protein